MAVVDLCDWVEHKQKDIVLSKQIATCLCYLTFELIKYSKSDLVIRLLNYKFPTFLFDKRDDDF